jgi:kynurenine formamidase
MSSDFFLGKGRASGFTISCFPHKIRGASAGWTRAVAIFDDRLLAA